MFKLIITLVLMLAAFSPRAYGEPPPPQKPKASSLVIESVMPDNAPGAWHRELRHARDAR